MSIDLKTYTGGTITATDDAATYDILCGGESGVIHGCEVAGVTGTNQISLESGRVLIKGRLISIDAETILVPLNSSGTTKGELYIRMDLGNDASKIALVVDNKLHDLEQDENCNFDNGVYEYRLATFDVGTTVISNVEKTWKSIHNDAVKKSGDTMTGDLVIPTPAETANNRNAATTEWVRNLFSDEALGELSRTDVQQTFTTTHHSDKWTCIGLYTLNGGNRQYIGNYEAMASWYHLRTSVIVKRANTTSWAGGTLYGTFVRTKA